MNEQERKLVEDVGNRYRQLAQQRKPWESVWEDIARFVVPKRVNFEIDTNRQAERPKDVYSSVGGQALDLMCNGLIGYLVSRTSPWMRTMVQDRRLMEYPEVRQYCQDCDEALYSEFDRSNFYDIMSEVFHDGGGPGTADVHVDEDITRSRINYTARHLKEVYLADDRYGTVDTVIRRYQMTAKQIIEEFRAKDGDDDNRLGEDFVDQNKDCLYKPYVVIHAVYPRKERDLTKDDNRNKRYAVVYMLEKGSILLRESGLDEMCDVVWRWDKNADEVYGRSPAWTALADILRANRISRDLLRLGEYTVNPAVQYPARIENRISLMPGGKNPYRDPNEIIQPIKLGEYPVGHDRETVIIQNIREAFFVDFFLGLQQVTKTMTVPEVLERQSEKATVLSSAVGRIDSELLDPLIDKTFRIAQEAGRMPDIPEVLLEQNAIIKYDYIGPLAQILNRTFATGGVKRALESVLPYMQAFPDMLDLINGDELAKSLMVGYGMPEKVIRRDEEVAQIRQARAMQQAALQKQQALESLGKAAPGLNQQAQEGSILSQIANGSREAVDGSNIDGQV